MPDMQSAWIEGDPSARWASAAVLGPATGNRGSGASLLEVPAGCRLARHTDSAEEVVVVIEGEAAIDVGGEVTHARAGDLALVPESVPHEVRNTGGGVLRFAAVYAKAEVTTTYEQPVQPDGERERSSTAT
jgi:mannose-6-phosphate isomerase-like protein (cupin superfamily)